MLGWILFIFLIVSGCSQKNFSEGECIGNKHDYQEKWEEPLEFKIVDVGINSYLVIWWNENGQYTSVERGSMSIDIDDTNKKYIKINCPGNQ